jgi:hypothetical protein
VMLLLHLHAAAALRLSSTVWPGHCCLQRQHDPGTTKVLNSVRSGRNSGSVSLPLLLRHNNLDIVG